MIQVTNEVPIYEADGKPRANPSDGKPLLVQSQFDARRVELVMPSGERVTVVAADLKAALENATNTRRY